MPSLPPLFQPHDRVFFYAGQTRIAGRIARRKWTLCTNPEAPPEVMLHFKSRGPSYERDGAGQYAVEVRDEKNAARTHWIFAHEDELHHA